MSIERAGSASRALVIVILVVLVVFLILRLT
jgi:hypothetical protein